jgi:hypothetical protein
VEEVEAARALFPSSRSYLDVYDRFGLLRERAVYAHCLHLDEQDRRRMAQSGAVAAFCPTSNLYLGSGLFDVAAADASGMRFALATDVGAGTSFSMLRTMDEAYKVAQLQDQRLTALRCFYLATLGGARALRLDDRIGSFEAGREADFIVLDPDATPLLERRMRSAKTLEERSLRLDDPRRRARRSRNLRAGQNRGPDHVFRNRRDGEKRGLTPVLLQVTDSQPRSSSAIAASRVSRGRKRRPHPGTHGVPELAVGEPGVRVQLLELAAQRHAGHEAVVGGARNRES